MVGLIGENVNFREVSGEEKSCTPEMTASWKELICQLFFPDMN